MKQKIQRTAQNHQQTKDPAVIADTTADPRKLDDLTEQQKNALRDVHSQIAAEPAPGLKILNHDAGFSIAIDHPDQQIGRQLLMDAMGTRSVHFCNGLLPQLVDAASTDAADQTQTNFMLSVVTSTNPDNQYEAMSKALMAASFNAAMDCHGKTLRAFGPAQLDSASRAARQFEKSFVDLWDALARHKGRGAATVNVETVNVSQGSQAIVGNVIRPETSPLHDTPTASAPPALTDQKIASMPIIGENKERAPAPEQRCLKRFRP